jgi:hypothetical protein
MTEDRRSNRTPDKADEKDPERLQHANDRIGFGKEQFAEDQPGHRTVEQEVVPFDRRADRAGDDGSPQLPAMFGLGDGARWDFGCRHRDFLQAWAVEDAPCLCFSLSIGRSYRLSSRC